MLCVLTENPNSPLLSLKSTSSSVCLEYNPKDPTSLISGMSSGQVSAFDTRADKNLVGISKKEISHRESVNSVLWINSKTGTEFISGSFDGQVIWYVKFRNGADEFSCYNYIYFMIVGGIQEN